MLQNFKQCLTFKHTIDGNFNVNCYNNNESTDYNVQNIRQIQHMAHFKNMMGKVARMA